MQYIMYAIYIEKHCEKCFSFLSLMYLNDAPSYNYIAAVSTCNGGLYYAVGHVNIVYNNV